MLTTGSRSDMRPPDVYFSSAVRRLVAIVSLLLGCSDSYYTCGSGVPLRSCPALPEQVAVGEIVGVFLGFKPESRATVVASVTASIAAHGGHFEFGQLFEFGDTFTASIDRGAAEVVCNHGLITRVEEIGYACPTE